MELVRSVVGHMSSWALGRASAPASIGQGMKFTFPSTDVCVHGRWYEANKTCVCDAGWITGMQQDALAPVFLWCNSTDPFVRYPPEKNLPGRVLTALGGKLPPWAFAVIVVLVPVIVIILGCVCCCCCYCRHRRPKPDAGAQPTLQQQQGMVNAPVQYPQVAIGSGSAAPVNVIPSPTYTDATAYVPVVSTYHSTSTGLGPAYFYCDPSAAQFMRPTEPQPATGNGCPSMDQRAPMIDETGSSGTGGTDRSPFASTNSLCPMEETSQGPTVLPARTE
ncbi:adenylate kinase [Trypanosoma conorhini]|uniref:Adenylate kinase n=1 Tax=Trypanosoma conorhini TaxID=83891 RepID=A0A3R7LNX8_9TRYP|nr:adenylate kinase [Trypanosoma conorhini]RNF18021.1 adenylate kinase [Trypanosoma conorhini]